jgi:hypothetical protein
MVPNAFIGKPKQPTDQELTAALGRARTVWDALLDRLAKDCSVVTQEWNSYSRKYGWSMRLKVKDRNIVHLSPCRGCFHMAMILGDKAIAAARQGKPSKSVLNLIKEGKKYPEGTAVRIEPVRAKNIPTIVSLAKIKLAH